MEKKSRKILIVLGVVLGLVGVATLSYAFLSVGGKQELANTFKSGCLSITIENESNAISLNGAYPITDVEGLSTEGYNFTINNTCSTSENYIINLENIDRQANSLSSDYLKISLNSDTFGNIITKLSSNEVTTPTISNAYEAYTIYKGKIEGNTTKTFKLREWLDYDATKEQAANKVIKNKINVIAKSDIEVENKTEVLLAIDKSNSSMTGIVNDENFLFDVHNVSNVNNDETYPFDYDEVSKTFTSTNKEDKTTSSVTFSAAEALNNASICYEVSSESNYDKAIFYLGDTEIGRASGEQTGCIELGNINESNTIKVEYSKDSIGSKGQDEVMFYLVKDIKTNGKYCTTRNNVCDPNVNMELTNNKINENITLNMDNKIVSTALGNIEANIPYNFTVCVLTENNKTVCSDPSNTGPDFSKTSCSSGCKEATVGIYETIDNDGKSYYYRGDVTNNYLKFGKWSEDTPDLYYGYSSISTSSQFYYNSLTECESATNNNCTKVSRAGKEMWWRIIRINGDGTIRLIYDGTEYHANGTETIDSIAVGDVKFNSDHGDNAYVGFMYGAAGSSTLKETHANINKSDIMQALETWYTNNLASYSSKIDPSAGFCGDRTPYIYSNGTYSLGGGTGRTITSYGAVIRNIKGTPSLRCNVNDLYTLKTINGGTSGKGNNALDYPIGLITQDEVLYAGQGSRSNYKYYLRNGQSYWTMSPSSFSDYYRECTIYNVHNDGSASSSIIYFTGKVRPVINLRADTKFTYNSESTKGTMADPYIVE